MRKKLYGLDPWCQLLHTMHQLFHRQIQMCHTTRAPSYTFLQLGFWKKRRVVGLTLLGEGKGITQSITLIKMFNWTTSYMSVNSSKVREKRTKMVKVFELTEFLDTSCNCLH